MVLKPIFFVYLWLWKLQVYTGMTDSAIKKKKKRKKFLSSVI